MSAALERTATWPVGAVAAAIVVVPTDGEPEVHTAGDTARPFRLASIAKVLTAWATLVAVEEGSIALDTPVGQPGCTLRHLLGHAGGYAFDGHAPVAPPGRRRIYSNTGIELAAAAVAEATDMPFATYLGEALFEPLGMRSSTLRGSPAHGVWSTADDLVRFSLEVIRPTLLSPATVATATSPVFAHLAGIVPGIGRFDPCPWGLGVEIHGSKHPHWMGTTNSPAAFGHFGGSGTMWWVDPAALPATTVACLALTDRDFDEWAPTALVEWPLLSDTVLREAAA